MCEQPDTQTYRQTYIFPFETTACAPSYGAERGIHTMKSPSPKKDGSFTVIYPVLTPQHISTWEQCFTYTEWTTLHT